MRHSLSWSERIFPLKRKSFPWDFLGFPESVCTGLVQKFRIIEHLKRHMEKVTFCISTTYQKIQEQFNECKEFQNQFICIISEVQGVQEFQEFLRSSRTGLFALSQNILKNIFIENYFNSIILKYQHSASRSAQQQNKEDAYIKNLANLLCDQYQQINKTELNF